MENVFRNRFFLRLVFRSSFTIFHMVNKKIKISYTYPSYDLHLTGSLFFHLRLCVSMIPAWFLVAWAFPTFPGGLFSPNKYYGLK